MEYRKFHRLMQPKWSRLCSIAAHTNDVRNAIPTFFPLTPWPISVKKYHEDDRSRHSLALRTKLNFWKECWLKRHADAPNFYTWRLSSDALFRLSVEEVPQDDRGGDSRA